MSVGHVRAVGLGSACEGRVAVKEEKIEVEGESSRLSGARCSGSWLDGGTRCSRGSRGRCASTTSASSRRQGQGRALSVRPDARPDHLPTDVRIHESPPIRQAHVRALPRDQAARHDHGHLLQPPAQAEAGLGDVARIAGVNLPNQKRLEIGLTYIYGIGQPTARKVCARARPRPRHEGPRPDRRRGHEAPRLHRREPRGRGRSSPRPRSRRSSGSRRSAPTAASATGAACPCAGSARRRTRARARARRRPSAAGRRRSVESGAMAPPRKGDPGSHAPPRPQEHRGRPGAHQDDLQQHDRRPHRQGGQRDRLGVRRLGRVQGLAQVDAVRRPGDRRRLRPQGHGARPAEGRGLRQGAGLGSRDGDPLAPGRRARDPRRQGRLSAGPQRRAARRSGGGSSGQRSRPRSAASAAARA